MGLGPQHQHKIFFADGHCQVGKKKHAPDCFSIETKSGKNFQNWPWQASWGPKYMAIIPKIINSAKNGKNKKVIQL